MAFPVTLGAPVGNSLLDILTCAEIRPGESPSYQMCKTIFSYHPLGAKMAESPVSMAMSQKREIAVPDAPEERVIEAFNREWEAIGADKHIFNVMRLARVYGLASVALVGEGIPPARPIDYKGLYSQNIAFSVFDPLNTAGSLVLNQNPNAIDFLKTSSIVVNGVPYHRSRSCTILNEDPIYLDYTQSAFGFVGRSVYQRALFPLKSFIGTMVTDDMISKKAGLIIAKMKGAGSIIDRIMAGVAAAKRELLKQAETNNVLSVDVEEEIESLNLQNIDGAGAFARKNILENIASSADMPAKLLNAETFAEGFGEGTEDAKHVARYIDRIRVQMRPLYVFFDGIVQHRAWNPEFYKTIQNDFPDIYGEMGYTEALYRWKNSFSALWPSLLIEPESEQIKVDDVKLKAVIAMVEVLQPELSPRNKALLYRWAADNINENKLLFQAPLELDWDDIESYEPPNPLGEEKPGKPFAAADSARRRPELKAALDELSRSVARLPIRDLARKKQ
jgi:hypothetical protein